MLAGMRTSPERTSARNRTREDIYSHIRAAGRLTRSALVELTGLSPSTVGHAVSWLLSEGRIVESDLEDKGPGSGSGRPATILRLAPSDTPIAAIDFGHSHIRIAIGNSLGETIEERTLELDVDLMATEALDLAVAGVDDLCRRHGIDRLGTVVAGTPGPVDPLNGAVRSPTILSSWVGIAPKQELQQRLGTTVHVENDATLGALGELRRGIGRFHRDFLYVKASHGIGAGLVINGEVYRGATGLAGEIGHTPLAGRSELCRCRNRGCLESVVSVRPLREQILHSHPYSPVQDTFSFDDFDDAVTQRILNEAGRTLGRVLADLCNLLNPTALIIGGQLGASAPELVEGVRASVVRYAQPATAAAIEVVQTSLGSRAELVGALELAGRLANP
jgi:predicted NBD/HSP70 family sugar kinase